MTDKIDICTTSGDVLGTYVVDLSENEKAMQAVASLLVKHNAQSGENCTWRKTPPRIVDLSESDIKEECREHIVSNFPEATQRNITMAHALGQLDAGDQATFAAGLAFVNACRDKCQECINNSEPIYSVEWPQAPADLAGLVANY